MSRQQDVDELFDVKNSFFIGNYTQCIKEAENNDKVSTEDLRYERLGFLYRSYLAQKKYRVIFDEVTADSPAPIKPIGLLASYLAYPDKRTSILQQLEQMLSAGITGYKHLLILSAATIYYHEGNYEAALRVLHQGEHLEYNALNLHIYLKIDRLDLAQKELKLMQEKDDDATLTQLSQAWLNISMGGDKLQDAYYIFQEMIDKHGSTSLLLNGQAACYMGQAKYQEAQRVLQEAMEKDSNSPDTLVNMTALAHHLGKPPEVANRSLSQLQDSHANHDFVREYNQKKSEFERLCKQYYASA